MNWPAKAGHRGIPDSERSITAPGPRVWETWKESYEVFRKDGSAPLRNDSEAAACGSGKLLTRTQKIDDQGIDSKLQAVGAEASPPPLLTDQQGRLIRYEIRMNKIMFDYIVVA